MGRPMTEQIRGDLAQGAQADDKERESAHDRQMAFATASRLGIALQRLVVEDNKPRARVAAEELAEATKQANAYARAHPERVLLDLASIALKEWLQPNCGRCQGRGKVNPNHRRYGVQRAMIDCPKCDGQGLHRFTFGERCKALGRRLSSSEEKRIDEMLRLIQKHDAFTGRVINRVLKG